MAGYRQSNPDRAKAAAATLAVHLAIGAALLTGLANHIARQQADALKTFDVIDPPPPPEVIKPAQKPAPKDEAAPPNLKANPSPVVAPESKLPAPTPLPAAPVAGTGSATSAGASDIAGPGTGAGGNGNGRGGGGTGEGFTPARKITKIPDREYRRIAALSGSRTGSVGLSIRVGADGAPANCRIARSSGNPSVDALMCQLTMTWVRFQPARDPQGRPVGQDLTWYPDWSPR